MLHVTYFLFQLEHTYSHTCCILRLYRETTTQSVTNVTKVQWVFWWEGITSSPTKRIKPSW
jgi:hypothetical protein